MKVAEIRPIDIAQKVDWPEGCYISIVKRYGDDIIENESGIKVSTLEFSPFKFNWELYSEE